MNEENQQALIRRGIIFSDVDGTFLDSAYQPCCSQDFFLEVIARYDVVFVSSRSIEEMLVFQRQIGHRAPFIAENGGVVVMYDKPERAWSFSQYSSLLNETVFLMPLGCRAIDILPFVKFAMIKTAIYAEQMGELSLERLAQLSGYSLQEAQYAQRRLYSVAISTEHCSPEQQTQLIEALRTFGCEASASGRWIMVTRDTNKGQAVQWYRGWAQQQHIRHRLVAGIGNESNDSSLLENVDLLFVIQNSQGYADVLQKLPQAHLLISQGVQGWKEMVYVLDTY